uniref:Trichohyalin-like n=1 Tax=Cacopsylla melanoneura TaxID=428564 RepID=A0A8D8YP45_9HEMI
MRGWLTILVTVTFTTSTWCDNYHSQSDYVNTFEASNDRSFQISKGQEKILKDFPHLKKEDTKKHGGHTVHDSSVSSISLSSEERSSKDSSRQSKRGQKKKKQQPKQNIWKNYARGKYGVEESVDLSILTKKTSAVRSKVKEQTLKHVKTTKGKDESIKRKLDEDEEAYRKHKKSTEYKQEEKKLKEKPKQVKKKPSSERENEEESEYGVYDANQKRAVKKGKDSNRELQKKIKEKTKQAKKKGSSESKTEEQMEFEMSDAIHRKGKARNMDSNLKSKMETQKSGSKSKSDSYEFSDSQSDLNSYRESDISKYIQPAPPESGEQTETSKTETSEMPSLTHKKGDEDKPSTKKVEKRTKKVTVIKTKIIKTKAKESYTDEEEDDYEDEDLGGQTYEGSVHHVKHETKTGKTSEDHESTVQSKHHRKTSDNYDYNYPSGTREIKKKIRKLAEKKTADNTSELNRQRKLKKRERKYMHHTTQKEKPNIKGKPTKRPKDKLQHKKEHLHEEHKKEFGSESEDHEKEITYTKEGSSERDEKYHTRHEGPRDPLDMSTEELMRYHDMANNMESTTTTTHSPTIEMMKPTTLKPTGTDHWICPSYVKSQTIEIHWSNYDERGEKRVQEKPIEAKFRNNMKKFSTRELKGRLRDTQRRGQLKGMAPFDASAALKRVRFHDVFKIDPIDDDDIFRNVTYQPTCSREFEVRMLEKNYRQKYGRRMSTAEEQREFAYMLNFIGNNSAALSEDTIKKIQNDDFEKLLACCDTKEVSSIMADFKDSAPQKIAYLKKMGRHPLTTSEEVSKMEREENPEYRKRLKFKKTHGHKFKLNQIDVLPDENKNIDPEYIANTKEAEQPLVSEEQEEEQETRNTALTYFPGGRYINTEELEEMKKENEYYERMKKLGGRITRLYDPNNILSSAEWAALEATTTPVPRYRNPHRYTNPHHQLTSVRGRRKRSVRSSSRSKESSKTEENIDSNSQTGQTKEKEQATRKGISVEDSPLPDTELNEHFMESSQDQWSSIQTNNSEISFDISKGSKKEHKTLVTDKRLGKVLNILKRYQRPEENETDTGFSWEKRMANLFIGLTESTQLPTDPGNTVRSSKIENAHDPEAEILQRTKRLKSKTNLTMSDELYRALGGPLPYSPNYWPSSFLQSSRELEHVKHEFGTKSGHEIKAMIKRSIYRLNHTEDSFEQHMWPTTVPVWRAWLGHTDPQRKIWGQHKDLEEHNVEDINQMKIMDDLKKTLNETTKPKKQTAKKKVTGDRVLRQNQNKYDDRSKEKIKRKIDRKPKTNDDSYEEKPKRRKEGKPKFNEDSYDKKPKTSKERRPRANDDTYEVKRKRDRKTKFNDDSSEEKPIRKREKKRKFDDDDSNENTIEHKQKKPNVPKGDKLNDGITPPKISRRDRAKRRDKTKYGSEYSDVMRERKRKEVRSSESRSKESRDRSYRRRDESRERRPRGREREIRGRRTERRDDRGYEGRRYRDSRERKRYDSRGRGRYDSRYRGRYDSRNRGRYDSRDKSESRKVPRKTDRLRKGRPERFKKKDRKNKRSKREVKYYVSTTTVEPIFMESRSEYHGKIVIDKAWVTRRRAYLAQKYARLDREEKERQLRKKGKLKEGQTISTRVPRVDYFDDKDLEQVLRQRGLTKRKAIDSERIDVEAYEKLENEYIKNKKRFHKHAKSSEHSSDYLEKTKSVDSLTVEEEVNNIKINRSLKTLKAITNNKKQISTAAGQTKQTPFIYTLGSGHASYIDVSKYNKAEADYMTRRNITSSSSGLSSYLESADEDKDYVTDHNPDYGSLERMQEIENNLVIDYKNKEVYFKNSPRPKFSKEDPTLTIPTWPTKRKNRFVRPQDRKLCYFNPSTTNKYRQALYVWHKYNQLKAAHERKENIDDIPSLDSDY